MFLNNPASTRSILANNENATAGGENSVKKAGFNGNARRTPHRNNASSKNGQTTQRRRRALGDISNRKAAGGGGVGKGGVALKGSVKPDKASFPSSSTKPRAAQVKFSKTPAAKSAATSQGKARLGGANSKPKLRTSSAGYDGVFGATTRWSGDDVDERRSPFDLVPEEELDMLSDLQDEMLQRHKKENDERDGLEQERCEKQLMEQIRAVHEANERNVAEMGTMLGSCGIAEDDPWDLLDQNLPWEEEDEIDHSSKERSPSGLDPYALWDDI